MIMYITTNVYGVVLSDFYFLNLTSIYPFYVHVYLFLGFLLIKYQDSLLTVAVLCSCRLPVLCLFN
jgi:hypothetical protein